MASRREGASSPKHPTFLDGLAASEDKDVVVAEGAVHQLEERRRVALVLALLLMGGQLEGYHTQHDEEEGPAWRAAGQEILDCPG